MTKTELINRIVGLNQTAGTEFLGRFTVRDLTQYLRRLESLPALLVEVDPEPAQSSAYAAAG